jgi:predicted AAA+ superfamily ATPase
MFGAVLVTDPRQVGKTTLLEEVAQGVRHVTLARDDWTKSREWDADRAA